VPSLTNPSASIVSLALFFVCLLGGESSARTWTNPDGQTIEAEILDRNDRTVILVMEDGRKFELAINKLSIDDQLFLKTWSKPPRRPLYVPEEAVYYNGSWYSVVFESVSWQEASEQADRLRAQLACVKDEQLNQILLELAQGRWIWLGGSDEEEEGKWTWADGEPFDYSNWEEFQPDNRFDWEHYLCLGPAGYWIDQSESPRRMRVSGFALQWD